MPNVATWMRPKDKKWFRPFFAKHPDIHIFDARKSDVPMDQMDGLLLTGGSDITPEFLHQENVDPTLIHQDDLDPKRDRWEFEAILADRGIERVVACDAAENLERQVKSLHKKE